MGVASGKAGEKNYAGERTRSWRGLLQKRIWLPKYVYIAVPYFYLACGMCAFLATLYIAEWFWLLPHYLLFSFACVHMGIMIFRRRSKPIADEDDRRRVQRSGE